EKFLRESKAPRLPVRLPDTEQSRRALAQSHDLWALSAETVLAMRLLVSHSWPQRVWVRRDLLLARMPATRPQRAAWQDQGPARRALAMCLVLVGLPRREPLERFVFVRLIGVIATIGVQALGNRALAPRLRESQLIARACVAVLSTMPLSCLLFEGEVDEIGSLLRAAFRPVDEQRASIL